MNKRRKKRSRCIRNLMTIRSLKIKNYIVDIMEKNQSSNVTVVLPPFIPFVDGDIKYKSKTISLMLYRYERKPFYMKGKLNYRVACVYNLYKYNEELDMIDCYTTRRTIAHSSRYLKLLYALKRGWYYCE